MRRPVLGFGVIAVLVIAIWAAVASGNDDAPPTTTTGVTVPSTSTSAVPSTTEAEMTTSSQTSVTTATTVTSMDPEVRVEEVRLILQDLYYQWFDAIYHNDEEAVRDVVGSENKIDDFRRAAANQEYPRQPTPDDIVIDELTVLEDNTACLVAELQLDLTAWRGPDAVGSTVVVLRPLNDRYLLVSNWQSPDDLWQNDCPASD